MMNGFGKAAAAWCCAAVWVGAGCTEEGATADGPGEPVAEEFRAVLPEAEESGEALVWEPGDTLGFWRDQYNVNLPFALTEDSIDDGGRRGLFYGTLYGAMSEGVSAWVYYPYDAGAAMSAQSVVTEFPGVQRCEPGRRPLVPLAGRYAGDPVWMEFAMRPLCAVVEAEVSLAAETETPVRLQSIVFHGNNGERVSGAMTVSFADEVPSVSFASDGGRTLTLDCGAGAVLAREPQRFRIVVPAGRYEQGYTLDFRTDRAECGSVAVVVGDGETVLEAGATYAVAASLETFRYSMPDAAFRNWLVELGYVTVTDDRAGTVEVTEAGRAVRALDCRSRKFTSLDGIECFAALEELDCSYNRLVRLDAGRNRALATLRCRANGLVRLDVAGCAELEALDCNGNALESLDVTGNARLATLYCNGNRLTELDVVRNDALETLYCYANRLVSLDASHMASPGSYLLYCGQQQEGGTLELVLRGDQRARWEETLAGAPANARVAVP